MNKIQSIHIYPVKGMAGIQVNQAKLEPEGFQYDRRWMLVDQQGVFISQRNLVQLVNAKINMLKDELHIEINETSVRVKYNEYSDHEISVSVFDSNMQVHEVSSEVSEKLSKAFDKKVKLVQVSTATNRIKDFQKHIKDWEKDLSTIPHSTKVSFADGYPYLIVGTASMDLLNEKLPEAMNVDRFRANIIIETSVPHEEDHWKKIQIGDQELLVIKPCARCQVPTINQKTGVKGKEPSLTLSKYRRFDNKIMFGQNAISLSQGILSVGDELVTKD